MRIVHTADWHLGKKLLGHDRLEEQVEWLAALVDYVRVEKIDALLIAGDVFDRSVPPVEALALFGDTLESLTAFGCEVVVIAGNHDSAERLGFARKLFERSGVHLRTSVEDAFVSIVLAHGDEEVEVFALPYADPDAIISAIAARQGDLKPDIAREHGAAVEAFVQHLPAQPTQPMTRILMAHVFCVGGLETPESERPISAGGVTHVSPTVFDSFDYVALGHLHRPQQVAGRAHVRYAGSPLKYSISEHSHEKGFTRIDVDQGGVHVSHVPMAPGRDVVVLTDTFDRLLTADIFAEHCEKFVAAFYTDQTYVLNAGARLAERFPFLVQALPKRLVSTTEPTPVSRDTDSPKALLESFWSYARIEHELEPEQIEAFLNSLQKVTQAEELAGSPTQMSQSTGAE